MHVTHCRVGPVRDTPGSSLATAHHGFGEVRGTVTRPILVSRVTRAPEHSPGDLATLPSAQEVRVSEVSGSGGVGTAGEFPSLSRAGVGGTGGAPLRAPTALP